MHAPVDIEPHVRDHMSSFTLCAGDSSLFVCVIHLLQNNNGHNQQRVLFSHHYQTAIHHIHLRREGRRNRKTKRVAKNGEIGSQPFSGARQCRKSANFVHSSVLAATRKKYVANIKRLLNGFPSKNRLWVYIVYSFYADMGSIYPRSFSGSLPRRRLLVP